MLAAKQDLRHIGMLNEEQTISRWKSVRKSEEIEIGGITVRRRINSPAMWLVLISRLSIWLAGAATIQQGSFNSSLCLSIKRDVKWVKTCDTT